MYSQILPSGLTEADSNKFLRTLSVTLNRLTRSLVPSVACLPYLTSNPKPWYVSSTGPVRTLADKLWGDLASLRTDYGKHVENKYRENKLLPRNIFLLDTWMDKMNSIQWRMPGAAREPCSDDLANIIHRCGLDKRPGMADIFGVTPPKGQTSLGICMVDDRPVTGVKSDVWAMMMTEAKKILAWCQTRGFTWQNIDTRWKEVISELKLVYVPSVRLDRGPFKLRLLFMGNTPMYILENAVSEGIKACMRTSRLFGYLPKQAVKLVDYCKGRQVVSGDLVAMDLHINGPKIKAACQAWQMSCKLNEALMCVLYAYVRYAPIAQWDRSYDENGDESWTLRFQERDGINPSGSGMFVIIMNIIMLWIRMDALRTLTNRSLEAISDEELGIGFGDDHVVPLPEGVCLRDWINVIGNMGFDAKGSEVYRGQFKFLRMLFNETASLEPLVMSRLNNAACPESPGIASMSKELRALTLRAQLLPFGVMKRQGTNATYKAIYEKLMQWFSPKDQLLFDVDDADLSRLVGETSSELGEALFFAKRIYQVKDSLDVFLSND